MKAFLFKQAQTAENNPLERSDLPIPVPQASEILVRVNVCGICHTDLHIVEGDIRPPSLPVIPGHQIVGTVEKCGLNTKRFHIGDRVGIAWLRFTCGKCRFCLSGRENLCGDALFTGYHQHGGFAEYATVHEDYAYSIPQGFSDIEAAPLLCAGIIGYRALRLSEIKEGQKLGLYGFGSSAHIAIQIAVYRGCEVYVFTRGSNHQELAKKLGATWVGKPDDQPPCKSDGAIIFAPAGELVPLALKNLEKGGIVALAGIHMSEIPAMNYADCLFNERTLRSVTASTRQDGEELLQIAPLIPIQTETRCFRFEDINSALQLLKNGHIKGAGILQIK
jgi:alcohol dehydrogenase, propanol-preferring